MLINIDDIKIKKRIRHHVGDLEPLKDSLRRYGLMNPITINSKYELIAGERRLQAAKQLGWTSINAEMVDVTDKLSTLEMELEENNQRVPFTDEELLEAYTQLEKLRNPSFFSRLWTSVKNKFAKAFIIPKEKNAEEKLKKARSMSIFLFVGVGLVVLGSILYKKSFVTFPVHLVLDLIGAALILLGAFYFIRLIINRKTVKKYFNT